MDFSNSTETRQDGRPRINKTLPLALLVLLSGCETTSERSFPLQNKDIVARAHVYTAFAIPIEKYTEDIGRLPESLVNIVENPGEGKWRGPYTYKELLDPWGNPYEYRIPPIFQKKRGYDLWSKGPDGKTGTEDDIGNWDPHIFPCGSRFGG